MNRHAWPKFVRSLSASKLVSKVQILTWSVFESEAPSRKTHVRVWKKVSNWNWYYIIELKFSWVSERNQASVDVLAFLDFQIPCIRPETPAVSQKFAHRPQRPWTKIRTPPKILGTGTIAWKSRTTGTSTSWGTQSATMQLLKCGHFTCKMLTILTPCWSNLIHSSENYFLLFIHLFTIFIIQNFTETLEINFLPGTTERIHSLDRPTKNIYMFVYLCILLHGYWQVEKAQSLFRLIFSSDWLSFLANQRTWKFLSVNELVF